MTSAYGKLAQLNPFRYRGYVWDEETGLYSLGSRYYDPAWGRFLNADAAIDGNYSKRLPTLHDGYNRDFFASLDPNTLHDHVIPPIEPQPGPSPYINPYPTPDPSRKNVIIDMRPETALPIPAPTQPGIPGQGINWNLTIDSVPGTGSLLPKNIVSAIIVLLAGSLALA